jgi:hypothetical protein
MKRGAFERDETGGERRRWISIGTVRTIRTIKTIRIISFIRRPQ